jgi:hypothetical protein
MTYKDASAVCNKITDGEYLVIQDLEVTLFISLLNLNMELCYLTSAGKLLNNKDIISSNSNIQINFRLRGGSKLFELSSEYYRSKDDDDYDEYMDNEYDEEGWQKILSIPMKV